MNIIITGNVVEGFKFYGPFGKDEDMTRLGDLFDDAPEWTWAELLPSPKPKEDRIVPAIPVKTVTFEVKRVDVQRGPFWTVLHVIDGVSFGGDHHWLSKAGAEAAKRLYDVDPSVFGSLPEVVAGCFSARFEEDFPLVEG
jgi:hypothetical protein